MSEEDYPDDEDLQRIKEWDAIHDPKGLIDFIGSIWHWGEPYFLLEEYRDKWLLELHTGGWSGNEDIIEALHDNGGPAGFWMFYWQKSERGGHYYFKVPRKQPTRPAGGEEG